MFCGEICHLILNKTAANPLLIHQFSVMLYISIPIELFLQRLDWLSWLLVSQFAGFLRKWTNGG